MEAKQRRAAKWTSELRGRLRGKVAHLPIRRVLLGNGVRLCPQCPLPDDRDGFLERAVRDVAARVGGTPRRRVTRDGRSVKPPGKHACCEVWEVELPEAVAVVSLTDWNKGHRVTVPYVWIQGGSKFCAVFLVLCLCKQSIPPPCFEVACSEFVGTTSQFGYILTSFADSY